MRVRDSSRRIASIWIAARVAVCLSAVGIFACIPARPSISDIQGTYIVEDNFGREVLVLALNGAYQQTFHKPGATPSTHSGKWELAPADTTRALSSARVVLRDALVFRDDFGKELASPSRQDVALNVDYVWGKLELSFNPDQPGYRRQ